MPTVHIAPPKAEIEHSTTMRGCMKRADVLGKMHISVDLNTIGNIWDMKERLKPSSKLSI